MAQKQWELEEKVIVCSHGKHCVLLIAGECLLVRTILINCDPNQVPVLYILPVDLSRTCTVESEQAMQKLAHPGAGEIGDFEWGVCNLISRFRITVVVGNSGGGVGATGWNPAGRGSTGRVCRSVFDGRVSVLNRQRGS